jgi:hypothetical protein
MGTKKAPFSYIGDHIQKDKENQRMLPNAMAPKERYSQERYGRGRIGIICPIIEQFIDKHRKSYKNIASEADYAEKVIFVQKNLNFARNGIGNMAYNCCENSSDWLIRGDENDSKV